MSEVIFGGHGMVGSRYSELSAKQIIAPTQNEADITERTSLEDYLNRVKPQAVINFAAVTDVNYCETERGDKSGLAWRVNAIAPGNIAEICKQLGCFFVHISTDMVFTGSKTDPGPYPEDHPVAQTDELTWYGGSKAAGESEVLSQENCAVVRIIYPVRGRFPEKLDYARKIIDLYDQSKLYPMFTDQVMNVTYVNELAIALDKITSDRMSGIFHVATNDTTNPYEFASYLLKKTRQDSYAVTPTSFEDFIKNRDPRRYPQQGGLDVSATEKSLQTKFSSWKEVVDQLLPQL